MQALGLGNTDVGQKRTQNEDRFLIDDRLGLYVVSDGMGGHAAGEVAAETAIQSVQNEVEAAQDELQAIAASLGDPARLAEIAKQAVGRACARVHHLATSSPDCSGMGCTLTMLVVSGNHAAMAHVGDTRLYLHRAGRTSQMSTDHTFTAELVRHGHLKPEEAHGHMYSNVLTRSVGGQPAVQVDTLHFEVFPGDRFLLCSDGLSEYIPNTEWLGECLSLDELEEIPKNLVSFANREGGHDNVTAVVVALADPDAPEVGEPRRDSLYDSDALANVHLFQSLPLAQLERVRSALRVHLCAPGETLVNEGEPTSRLWIVADGVVEVLKGEAPVSLLGPGGHVGTATLLCQRAAGATLRTREASRVLELDGQQLLQLAHAHPWLGITLLHKLGSWLSSRVDPVNASGRTLDATHPDRWY